MGQQISHYRIVPSRRDGRQPLFDALRSDPRYVAVMRKMNLEP